MKVWSDSFKSGEPMPARCAFGKPNPQLRVELSDNKNPHLAWSDLPAGSKSLVVICHDSDVPSRADDVNQEGKTVPASLPRVDFYHWVLVDLAPDTATIADGTFSAPDVLAAIAGHILAQASIVGTYVMNPSVK